VTVDSTPPELDGIEVESEATDLSSEVRSFGATDGWPEGYVYAATGYADVILREAFPERFADLIGALDSFHPTLTELRSGGGGRTVFVKRFDDSLEATKQDGADVWRKRNIEIEKFIKLDAITAKATKTRDHEIDMFGVGTLEVPIPGIAVEMEWNNKDPFYDRDLISFQALYQEGAIAIGVIVTRGPGLQRVISSTIQSKDGGYKYGQSTTHWDKLIPRVNLGGGGGCPLILIGIEAERVEGIELAQQVKAEMQAAEEFRLNWRQFHGTWAEASVVHRELLKTARAAMPPLTEAKSLDEDESV